MMSHKEDDTMSEDCREQLRRRQKLMLENYKVSRGLAKACKQEIKENNCKKTSNTDIKTVRLAQILLCLEGKKCHLQYVCNKVCQYHRVCRHASTYVGIIF